MLGYLKAHFWDILPYLIPVIASMWGSFYAGIQRGKWKFIPLRVRKYFNNPDVMKIVNQVVVVAAACTGKTGDQKKAYAIGLVCDTVDKELGITIPDSVVNYLIEHVLNEKKGVSK